MKLSQLDRQKLVPLLEQLCEAVEDLLLTGLTTVSDSTRQVLTVTFQETSRLGLLRLGSTLRFANEELGRFTRHDAEFSRKRLSFFLNRAWVLSHGLERALRENDDNEFDRLSLMPGSVPVSQLKLVVMGMLKKLSAGVCSFEFRMRAIESSGEIEAGQRIIWSSLFPLKPGADLPADAYLHMPQKQKFTAIEFLQHNVIAVKDAAISVDRAGVGRLTLTEKSSLDFSEKFDDWKKVLVWDVEAALNRIQAHKVSPLDLEIELQEELVLNDGWTLSTAQPHDETQTCYPVNYFSARFNAIVSNGNDGMQVRNAMNTLQLAASRPPLFGLMHYERCKMILQPLTIFTDRGPEYLMLSPEKFDKKALVKALSFT